MGNQLTTIINSSAVPNDLKAIAVKALNGKRVSFDEGVLLFEKGDLGFLGAVANEIRQKRHGFHTFFNRNFHIEPTNICVFDCKFCSYSKLLRDKTDAWELSEEEIYDIIKSYDNNYADWSPGAREIKGSTADRDQVWMAPAYNKIDLHAYYNLPMQIAGANLQVFAHVFNLTDELYIQDATDNSQYNSHDKDHDADSAEVFFGIPRSFNAGISIRF